jgi:murein DD-endopeptidase MepM/ murein hydrolase activator NlpD
MRKHVVNSARAAALRQNAPRTAAALKTGGKLPSALAGILRSPWLPIALAIAGIAIVLVGSVSLTGISIAPARPALPEPAEADQALYSLLVPERAPSTAAGVNPVLFTSLKVTSYKTRSGDTLSAVASRFKLNIDTLVSFNGITDARAVSAGSMLDVPNSDGLRYTVRRGDTLQGIAKNWGVDLNGILDWNGLTSSVIRSGQQLFLPGARMNPTDLSRVLGTLFRYPIIGGLSSFFGFRPDPITGVRSFHNGIDLMGKPGTPILAAMAGVVAEVGFNRNFGNYVIIKHSGGYQTLYGHMTRYIVDHGQKVQQGQKIGEVGNTGYSTGPHLHFSIFRNGAPVDPLHFLK